MVKSMNQIAHALHKQTIAEFVENEETLILLKSFGVDFAQGHYLGKPGILDHESDWLKPVSRDNDTAIIH